MGTLPITIKPYVGNLDRKKDMPRDVKNGMEAYYAQRARSKKAGLPMPTYSLREFVSWWLKNLETFKGTVASCGRIDHKSGYSWDNIEMQDMKENSREGFLRNQLHIKEAIRSGKKVNVFCKKTNNHIATIPSIRETANLFCVSQRLIQFIVRGKIKSTKKINFNLEAVNP